MSLYRDQHYRDQCITLQVIHVIRRKHLQLRNGVSLLLDGTHSGNCTHPCDDGCLGTVSTGFEVTPLVSWQYADDLEIFAAATNDTLHRTALFEGRDMGVKKILELLRRRARVRCSFLSFRNYGM